MTRISNHNQREFREIFTAEAQPNFLPKEVKSIKLINPQSLLQIRPGLLSMLRLISLVHVVPKRS